MYVLYHSTKKANEWIEVARRDDIEDLVSVAEHHSGIQPLIWENQEEGILGQAFVDDDNQYLITTDIAEPI